MQKNALFFKKIWYKACILSQNILKVGSKSPAFLLEKRKIYAKETSVVRSFGADHQ